MDRLASLRLLDRQADPHDRRRVYLRLTRRGRQRLEKLASVHRAQLGQLRPQLTALLGILGPPRARPRP